MPVAAVEVPPAVVAVTLTVPTDPAGAVAVMEVAELTTTLAAALAPKLTAVDPLTNPVPVRVTTVPPATGPLVGLRPVTVGAAT